MNASPRCLPWSALLLTLACGETTPAPSTPPGPASASPSAPPVAPAAPSSPPPVASGPPVTAAPALRPIDPAVPLRPGTAPTPPGLATTATSQAPDVERMLGQLRSRFRACFQRRLDADPASRSSSMRWELTVDRDGHITRAKYVCQEPLAPEFRECMERAFRSVDVEPGPRTITTGECASR